MSKSQSFIRLAFFIYMFFVYILFPKKLNRFYIGSSDNFLKRIEEHNDIKYEDAFTARGIPWELFFVINCCSGTQAYQIEKHIKNMKSANYIRNFLKYPEIADKLLEKYK